MSNVGVAVRVRPLTGREKSQGADIVVRVDDTRHNVLLVTNPKKIVTPLSCKNRKREVMRSDQEDKKQTPSRQFSFDFCYNLASQEQIHEDVGTKILEAAFEGYNACVLAYGQSGSGKTFTMMGQKGDLGLIPRICKDLFNRLQEKVADDQLTYRAEVSFFEIYNEKVSDLLKTSTGTGSVAYLSQRISKQPNNLRVREHPKLGPCVQDLSKHLVSDFGSVRLLIERGIQHRRVAATRMHDRSSRSHAVFTINFTQTTSNEDLLSEVVSRIHLVDLAGSEKATIGMNKIRLKEGANINKSLVALGSVIFALAEKSLSTNSPAEEQRSSRTSAVLSPVFVPYRDSVLTWLLKESLGGNSKTILVATVSPASTAFNETVSTLRYAERAKCIVNKPVVNEDPNVKLIRQLKAEVTKLRHLLFDTYQDKVVKWTNCGHMNGDMIACRSFLSSCRQLFLEADENELLHFSQSLKSIGHGRNTDRIALGVDDIRLTGLVFDCRRLHNASPYPFRYWTATTNSSKGSTDDGGGVENEMIMDEWPTNKNLHNQLDNIKILSLQHHPVSNDEKSKVKSRSNWPSKTGEHGLPLDEASVLVESDIHANKVHHPEVLMGFTLSSNSSIGADHDYEEDDGDDTMDDSEEERLTKCFNYESISKNEMKSCKNRPKIHRRYFSGGCAKKSREIYATSCSSSDCDGADRRQENRRIKKRRKKKKKLSSIKRRSLDSGPSHLACSPPPLCKPLETSSFFLDHQPETTCDSLFEQPEMRQKDRDECVAGTAAMSNEDHLTTDSLEEVQLDSTTAEELVIKTTTTTTTDIPCSRGVRCERNRLRSWDSLTMVYMGPEWGSTETNIDHDHHSRTSSIGGCDSMDEEECGRPSCNEMTTDVILHDQRCRRLSHNSSTNALNSGPSEDNKVIVTPEGALPIGELLQNAEHNDPDVETSIIELEERRQLLDDVHKHSCDATVDDLFSLPADHAVVGRSTCCKCDDHVEAAVHDRHQRRPPPLSLVKRTSETFCQTSTVLNDTTSQTEPVRFAAGTQTNPLPIDVGTQTDDEAHFLITKNATDPSEFMREPTIRQSTVDIDVATEVGLIATGTAIIREAGIGGQQCSACSHRGATRLIDTSKTVQKELPAAIVYRRHVTKGDVCHSMRSAITIGHEEKEGETIHVSDGNSSKTIKRRRSRTCKQCSFFRRQLFRQLEQRRDYNGGGGEDDHRSAKTNSISTSTTTPLLLKNSCDERADRSIGQLRHSDYDSESEDNYRSLPWNPTALMRRKNNKCAVSSPCHDEQLQLPSQQKLNMMSEIDLCGREPADGDSMSAKPEARSSGRQLQQTTSSVPIAGDQPPPPTPPAVSSSSFVVERRPRLDVAGCAAPISGPTLNKLHAPKINCDQLLTVEVQSLLRECRAVRRKAWFEISEAVVGAASTSASTSI